MKELKGNNHNIYKFMLIKPGSIEKVNIGGILMLPKGKLETSKLLTIFQFDKYLSELRDLETGEKRQVITIEDSAQRIIIDGNIGEKIKCLGLHGQIAVLPLLPNAQRLKETLDKDQTTFEMDALQRESFTKLSKDNPYYRIDKQVRRMIEQVIQAYNLESKTNIFGHSALGLPAMRFSIIHPQIIDKLIIGGNADEVPTPFGENAQKLGYPFGIKDYEELFEQEFDFEAFSQIKFRYYIGEYEYLDPNLDVIRDDNYGIRRDGRAGTGPNFAPKEQADIYKSIYNPNYRSDYNLSLYERLQHVLEQYEKAGLDMKYMIYPQDCHSPITSADFKDAQFEGGKHFSKDGSKIVFEILEKIKQLETYALMEPMTIAKTRYAEATQKIYYNKDENSRRDRVEALLKVESEYKKVQTISMQNVVSNAITSGIATEHIQKEDR